MNKLKDLKDHKYSDHLNTNLSERRSNYQRFAQAGYFSPSNFSSVRFQRLKKVYFPLVEKDRVKLRKINTISNAIMNFKELNSKNRTGNDVLQKIKNQISNILEIPRQKNINEIKKIKSDSHNMHRYTKNHHSQSSLFQNNASNATSIPNITLNISSTKTSTLRFLDNKEIQKRKENFEKCRVTALKLLEDSNYILSKEYLMEN